MNNFTNIDKFSTKFVKFHLFNDFLHVRAVVGPPEVRFAHPVRLVPDTRSQGRCSWRTLQIAVYQAFNRNQSYGFHNSENT